jgi:flagellar biosynthesis anti-sigma factor FlgM
MGISKIGSLFASNIDAVSRQLKTEAAAESRQADKQSDAQQTKSSTPSTDAVVYSRSMIASKKQAAVAADEARNARLQKIRDQIKNGQYRTDSDKVAVAVLKDLA